MNKKQLDELLRMLESLAIDCSYHLKEHHKISYEQYPYFENIAKKLQEFRKGVEA